MAIRCKASPYEGTDPYIFVSYSHRDKELVFPIIERLSSDGFRIWFDEGIDPGSEWISNIGDHLSSSAAVISFLSANSVASQNCREEIMFARDSHIPVLTVYLENVVPDQGLKLALISYQALFMYAYDEEDDFFGKLESATLLKPCRKSDSSAREAAGDTEEQAPTEAVSGDEDDSIASTPLSIPPAAEAGNQQARHAHASDNGSAHAQSNADSTLTESLERKPATGQTGGSSAIADTPINRNPQTEEPAAKKRRSRYAFVAVAAALILAVVVIAVAMNAAQDQPTPTNPTSSEPLNVEARQDYDEAVAEALNDPDGHRGETVSVRAKLEESSFAEKHFGAGSLMANTKPYSKSIYIPASELSSLAELGPNDYALLEGVIDAEGGTGFLTGISATKISRMEYVSPAQETWEVGESASEANVSLTVDKVEFTYEETRVYYTIDNGRSAKVHYSQPTLEQGSTTYEQDNSVASTSSEDRLNTSCEGDESTTGVVEYALLEQASFDVSLSFTSPSEMRDTTLTVTVNPRNA